MDKTAKCLCGEVTITVNEEPDFIAVCHCLDCQRRTGSVFGVSAYFSESKIIETSGHPQIYKHKEAELTSAKSSFCKICGSTVYWQVEKLPGKIGVAVGCFSDPNFAEPQVTVWTKSKHSWVEMPAHWRASKTQEF